MILMPFSVEGPLVAEAARIAVDAQVLAVRRRPMIHDVGFPIQIDVGHFEIVQRTEVLLRPQPNLENGDPRYSEQHGLSEELNQPLHGCTRANLSGVSSHLHKCLDGGAMGRVIMAVICNLDEAYTSQSSAEQAD